VIRSSLLGLFESHFGLALILIKVSIVFGAGFLLAHLARRRSAEVRHFVWMSTLLGALAMPLVPFVLPRFEWPILSPVQASETVTRPQLGRPSPVLESQGSKGPVSTPIEPDPSAAPILSVTRIWLAGALIVLVWCAIGHLALARIARRARAVMDDAWLALLEDTSRATKLNRPVRLLTSPSIDSPMTWGLRRPIVLLPETASTWTVERRRVVLLHELAHITRMDFLFQLIASMTCALYWFHPGAWSAARRLRYESEHACDDRAIRSGTPAADYASHLLCLALQSNARHWHEALAIGLARPSTLEARVRAVLNDDLTRRALSPRVRIGGSIVLGAFVLILSALTPVRAAVNSAVLEGPGPYPQPPEPEEVMSPEESEAPIEPERVIMGEDATPVVAANGSRWMVSRTLEAKPGEELELRLQAGGNVDIQGWDKQEVSVRAHVRGSDPGNIKVDIDKTESGVRVHAYIEPHSAIESSSNEFQIRVPRKFDLRLDSSGGGLHMSNVEGRFEGDTGGGEIVLEHVKGHASLSTGGSDIRVTDSHLSGDVNTGGGTVDLIRVNGGLVGSSGSGPVRHFDSKEAAEFDKLSRELKNLGENLEELTGSEVTVNAKELMDRSEALALHSKELAENSKELTERSEELTERSAELALRAVELSKSGGGITLTDIPRGATMSTGGGDVRIGRTAGPVVVSTGGGDMEIGPVYGSLHASTGAGDIQVRVAATDQTIDLSSGSGKITLEVPASFDGRIDLETAYTKGFGRATKIDCEWKLTRESNSDWDDQRGTPRRYVRAYGTLGDGHGRIRVSTVNGDIVLRRARQ
jgi:beta-lactamase regulating signal transducer with metallopeptidase domain